MRIRQHSGNGLNTEDSLEVFVAESGALSARINRVSGVLHLHSAKRPEEESAWYGDVERSGGIERGR